MNKGQLCVRAPDVTFISITSLDGALTESVKSLPFIIPRRHGDAMPRIYDMIRLLVNACLSVLLSVTRYCCVKTIFVRLSASGIASVKTTTLAEVSLTFCEFEMRRRRRQFVTELVECSDCLWRTLSICACLSHSARVCLSLSVYVRVRLIMQTDRR